MHPRGGAARPAAAVLTYLAVVGLGALGLVLLRGVLLGGLLAVLLAALLTVPLAVVLVHSRQGR